VRIDFPLDLGMADRIRIGDEVQDALANGRPAVALETAVLTHGLPRGPLADASRLAAWRRWVESDPAGPRLEGGWPADRPLHLAAALAMAEAVRTGGGVPATVGMIDGTLWIGLDERQLRHLAAADEPAKLSARDLAPAMAGGRSGGTTVAGTLAAMAIVEGHGLRTLATGGIGGAHRGWAATADVSADLRSIAETRACVVASGAKAILDLPATIEMLDTLGVAVLGHRTAAWPRFVLPPDPSLAVEWVVDDPRQAAATATLHWEAFGRPGGVLLLNPVPPAWAVAEEARFESALAAAIRDAEARGPLGPAVTPMLLGRIAGEAAGALEANLALLLANARLAAEVAAAMAAPSARRVESRARDAAPAASDAFALPPQGA
jgi:pseudouridine-5'-phosphate glycosidase